MKYKDRERAEGFGLFSESYDRTRPSYAKEFINWLSANGTGNALDIGSGTGQVAIMLAKAGWKVIGIEPDNRMACVARSHHVEVIVTAFEQWVPDVSDFDLITAGTSWHWIDPDIGYEKAASLLKVGGRLAIFRNFYAYHKDVNEVIRQTLSIHAPKLLAECVPLGISAPGPTDSHKEQIENKSNLFSDLQILVFPHERLVSIERWIEELSTHSPIFRLHKTVSTKLLRNLANRVRAKTGDKVKIMHETHCLVAWKR